MSRLARLIAATTACTIGVAGLLTATPSAQATASLIPCDGDGTAIESGLWVYNAASLQSRKPVADGGTNLILNGDFEQGWNGVGEMFRLRPAGTNNTDPSNPEQYQPIPSWTSSGGGPSATSDSYGGWGDVDLYGWDPNHSTLADPTYGGAPGLSMVYFGNGSGWWWEGKKPTFVGAGDGKAAQARPSGSITFANATPDAYGTNATPVKITQTVSNLTPGTSYRLQFWQSSEDARNGDYANAGMSAIDITGYNRTFLVIPTSDQQYTLDFIATNASTTISFISWGHVDLSLEPGSANSAATELVLDDVILTECASVTGTRPAYVPTVEAVDDYYVGMVGLQVRGAAGDLDTYDTGSAFTKLTNPANGSIQFGNDGTFTFTPTPGWKGQTSFDYRVCLPAPDQAVCDTATEYIVIGGPVDDYYTTPYETPMTEGYAPAGDIVPPTDNNSGVYWKYDSDGYGSGYSGFRPPSHGTVSWGNNPSWTLDGSFTYTPDPGFSGDDSFTYQLCYEKSPYNYADCATAVEYITVPGPGATIRAVNDYYLGTKNTPINGSAGQLDTFTAGASFTKLGDPIFGAVTWNPDGTFTYTPNNNFVGVDSFPYKVCEPAPNQTVCATAVEYITIPPDGVSINAVNASYTTPLDTPMTTGNASAGDTFRSGSTFSRMTNPKNGTVTGWNSTTGRYTYTPDTGWFGTDTFTYRVCLPAPNSWVCDVATETITVPNPNPPAPPAPAPNWMLSYVGQGGVCTTPTQTVVDGGIAIVGDGKATCTRPGYTFAGWRTSPTGTSVVAAGTPLTMTADAWLYAAWEPVTNPPPAQEWTLTYDGQGGVCSTPSQTVADGAVAVVGDGLATCARPGYTFAGWRTAPGGSTVVASGTALTMTADVKLYASWTPVGPPPPVSSPMTPPFVRDFGVTSEPTRHVFQPLKRFKPSKGATVVASSLQLRPKTGAGWDRSVTVPGKGTFTVVKGRVVFIGVPGWSGTAVIRYRAQDTSGQWAASTLTVMVAKVPGGVYGGR